MSLYLYRPSSARQSEPLLLASPPTPPRLLCKRIRYFHIPKAGSSFAEYVWAWACPSLPLEQRTITFMPNVSGIVQVTSMVDLNRGYRAGLCPCSMGPLDFAYHHQSLEMEYMIAASAGLFRAPAARIVSAFNYGLHANRMEPASRAAMKAAVGGASESRQLQLDT